MMALTDDLERQIDYFAGIAEEMRTLLSRALDAITERDAQIATLTATPFTDEAVAAILAAAIVLYHAHTACQRLIGVSDTSDEADDAFDEAQQRLFALVGRALKARGR